MHSLKNALKLQIVGPSNSSKIPKHDTNTHLSPKAIAEQYWQIHDQPPTSWTHELDICPATKNF